MTAIGDNVHISLVALPGGDAPTLTARLIDGGVGLLITDFADPETRFYRLRRDKDGWLRFTALEESPEE